ncbi:tRNA (adenosine(37)-N6)-dimethylallyltransferase MiaA [Persicirhabdus sediminis]|uniref:tRNA dimethylallyltransferase n=1 Tax=Persicirhabdus sediminis TaxID=454144 RepID=A0A8J7SK48_9BACT|nr:tRNA (adenosine(37)-N6)-dimethylallyltransferase MiaA [Persicirhabdus sediminis]MBK1789573.1 tRNA (adenosine(37)-N6)-dimethylallyltransferase MiaA [Persicirhabdus sediminis]
MSTAATSPRVRDLRPIYVCGPTASGKSALAIELARLSDGEVVNADAYQLYRGIDIISAAPSTDELASVPHHLFGVLTPAESCDAMAYRELTLPVIAEVQSRGKVPIVVGGSGLYLKFLTHGPSPVPSGDDQLRAELDVFSDAELVEKLQQLDPEGAAMTNLQNRRYVIRALEICMLSGQKMSVIKNDWAKYSEQITANLRGIYLFWERASLRERIGQRTQLMLEAGAVNEVAAVENFSETCGKAIGIPQILAHLAGEISLAECEELITNATRQYAKRQTTWFKKESWLEKVDVDESTTVAAIAKDFLKQQAS